MLRYARLSAAKSTRSDSPRLPARTMLLLATAERCSAARTRVPRVTVRDRRRAFGTGLMRRPRRVVPVRPSRRGLLPRVRRSSYAMVVASANPLRRARDLRCIQFERGCDWIGGQYREFYRGPLRAPLSIAFAFVATHNHFVLDRGGKVFKQSAPVIKLPAGASEDDHLALLGVLNSSTACFWLKQVCHDKGRWRHGGGMQPTRRGRSATSSPAPSCEELPLPADLPLDLRPPARPACPAARRHDPRRGCQPPRPRPATASAPPAPSGTASAPR